MSDVGGVIAGRGRELEARVGELQSALKVAERTHHEQLEGVRSEAAAELQAAQAALADAARQHEAQVGAGAGCPLPCRLHAALSPGWVANCSAVGHLACSHACGVSD
jgi:hypothetical protein